MKIACWAVCRRIALYLTATARASARSWLCSTHRRPASSSTWRARCARRSSAGECVEEETEAEDVLEEEKPVVRVDPREAEVDDADAAVSSRWRSACFTRRASSALTTEASWSVSIIVCAARSWDEVSDANLSMASLTKSGTSALSNGSDDADDDDDDDRDDNIEVEISLLFPNTGLFESVLESVAC